MPDERIRGLPDREAHRTGWSARKVDGIWAVGMAGNLDTKHDATVIVTGGWLSDDEAREVAEWIANRFNKERADALRFA
jgi:hypothetical protein